MSECLKGKENPSSIDNYIDQWHEQHVHHPISLHEYLGMSRLEYADWASCKKTIEQLLEERKKYHASDKTVKEVYLKVVEL